MLEAALERVDEDDLERRATLLALLGLELTWSAEPERRRRLCDEALELARRSGDDRTLAIVLWRRFNAISLPETLPDRIAEMEELKQLAERLGDPVLRFWANVYGSTPAMETGDRARLEANIASLTEIAEELRQPVPNWLAGWLAAVLAIVAGDLEAAERHAEQAAQFGADAGQADAFTFYAGQLQQIRWAQGRSDEVIDVIAQTVEDNPDLSTASSVLALSYCENDEPEKARELLESHSANDFERIPRDMLWLNTMAAWAEVAAAVEDAHAAAALYPQLEPWEDQFPAISVNVWMPVAHYLGRLAHVLGRPEDAQRHFARALELEERFEAPLFAATTRLAWGRSLLEGGAAADAARAQELLARAHADGERLGLGMIEQQAGELLAGIGAGTKA
jgi:tetratricopeptide (TPR) repeat protein